MTTVDCHMNPAVLFVSHKIGDQTLQTCSFWVLNHLVLGSPIQKPPDIMQCNMFQCTVALNKKHVIFWIVICYFFNLKTTAIVLLEEPAHGCFCISISFLTGTFLVWIMLEKHKSTTLMYGKFGDGPVMIPVIWEYTDSMGERTRLSSHNNIQLNAFRQWQNSHSNEGCNRIAISIVPHKAVAEVSKIGH